MYVLTFCLAPIREPSRCTPTSYPDEVVQTDRTGAPVIPVSV